MKKFMYVLGLVLLCSGVALAQNNNYPNNANNTNNPGLLAIGFGGSANYYYGPTSRNFNSFETDRVNWQLDGLLGLSLGRNKSGNRTLLAVFGTFGFTNSSTMQQMLSDQGYTTTAANQSSMNNFYRLEGGLLLGEIFRASIGVGQQMFNEQTLVSGSGVSVNSTYLQYQSGTVGFQYNVGAVAVGVNVNFAYGRDFERTVITPTAGVMFRL